MRFPPAVVIHGIAHARAVLALRAPVTLLSAPGAALYAGSGFWRALIDQARSEQPNPDAPDILDCADAAGYALGALRLGQHILVLIEGSPGRKAVASIAAQSGAVLLARRPEALDLAGPRALRRLEEWLRAGPSDDTAAPLG